VNMPYVAILSRDAVRCLDRLRDKEAMLIEAALDDLSLQRLAASHVKKLKGVEGQYRKRVGNFRILFEVDEKREQVYIFDIADRKDAYLP